MRAPHALALALALALLLPSALADHVYSHRLYAVGRVVDANGLPVAGAVVTIAPSFRVGGACFDHRRDTTDPQGDFELCRHAHALPSNGTVNVSVEGESRTIALDPDLRLVSAHIQLPGPARTIDLTGVREFNASYLVAGRHFVRLAEPVNVEAVHVNATPVGRNVTVLMLAEGDVVASTNATVDEHGDFEVEFAMDAIPEGAIVRVESERDVVEEPASALFRRSDVLLVRDDRLLEGPGEDAPGTKPAPMPAWIFAVALALSVAIATRARRR